MKTSHVDVVLICGKPVSGDGSNYCLIYGGWPMKALETLNDLDVLAGHWARIEICITNTRYLSITIVSTFGNHAARTSYIRMDSVANGSKASSPPSDLDQA